MKFLEIVNNKLQTLSEQVPGELPPVDPAAAGGAIPQVPIPASTAAVEPAPAEGATPLTSEGEVFLVRLLKKALFMNPGDLDEKSLKDLPEINETNASQVLTSIVDIMKKYSNSIDVETEPKTP